MRKETDSSWKVTGLCGGEGYDDTPNYQGRGEWVDCGRECTHSKIMLAFERFTPGAHYLSEKLFIPLEKGSVSAYFGNGYEYMDQLTVNRKAFIDYGRFNNIDLFADEIIRLLRTPDELQSIQDEHVFEDPDLARQKIMFVTKPLEADIDKAAPELRTIIRHTERLQALTKRRELTFQSLTSHGPSDEGKAALLSTLFSSPDIGRPKVATEICPDILLDWCC